MSDDKLIHKRTIESPSEGEKLFSSYVDMKVFARFFWRARWVMLFTLIITIIVGQIYLLIAPKKYSAVVTIAEKGSQGSASFNGGGGILAKLLVAKSETPGALSLGYAIKSTAVAERVVKSMNLQDEWLKQRIDKADYENMKPENRFTTAVSLVRSQVNAVPDRDNPGLVQISLTDKDGKIAYELLRQFLIELQYVMRATDLIFNKRVRLFYEDRLNVMDNRLLEFGAEIAKLYGENKLAYDKSQFTHYSQPLENYTDQDFSFGVSSLDFLAEIYKDVREEVKHTEPVEEISRKIEVPQQVYLTFLEDKYNLLRTLRASLSNQYESSLIGEKSNEQRFVVIEAPVMPTRPAKPNKKLITVLTFFGGIFLAFWSGIFYYLLCHMRQKILTV